MIDDVRDAHPVKAGVVAGIGLQSNAEMANLLNLIDDCLVRSGLARSDLVALTTLDIRANHPTLRQAAQRLDVPILALPADALGQSAPSPSTRVADAVGVSSVAEATALAFGPLVLEKQRGVGVTCALARYAPDSSASASIAASTLATSRAGP